MRRPQTSASVLTTAGKHRYRNNKIHAFSPLTRNSEIQGKLERERWREKAGERKRVNTVGN